MIGKKLKIFLIILIGLILISFLATIMESSLSYGKIAMVNVKGIIVDSKAVIEEIKQYRKNPAIKAIVLRVDSPGGAVVPSQEIYEEIKRTIKVKPVVVSMGSIAASGAYYISCPATKIIANPGTITGSIGVLIEIPNIKGLLDKIGVKAEVIKSGKYKDITSPLKPPLQSDEKEVLQRLIDDVHDQFVDAVSEGRKIPIEKVKKIADGRVFTGLKAKEIGLVDEIGDLEYAIKVAAQLGNIKGEPEIIMKKTTILYELLKGDTESLIKRLLPTSQIYYLYLPQTN
ncbi:MAG: signal peptide peptidase SppA [Thermodesulfovibrio sp.]|jgi:protease-4|uniref:signal peptide peptidase SppA n=1 Tax=unclassified Thermodesulfovibrio TaxID=2645936 RepID=UPI00083B3B40|nr:MULTISPECIES: signal peptide peptidase SppA [unclassified Thermodesulfovibrio]MDI1471738.1 signal peptide peptidase SppA [Thermodesulfovibrio sp. 1176]MDI6713629.1 signal peptide peptidase SppA [Thermodesulfovibrio sp.]ODA44225.1 signal peptide peptidase SppA, 36K type [Thermodesulfovibrio sp. N1]